MWISFDYQEFVKGNFIGLVCQQWTSVCALGLQEYGYQISFVCIWKHICFGCYQYARRFVIWGHPQITSYLWHTGLFQ
jgi:hypothetical protein